MHFVRGGRHTCEVDEARELRRGEGNEREGDQLRDEHELPALAARLLVVELLHELVSCERLVDAVTQYLRVLLRRLPRVLRDVLGLGRAVLDGVLGVLGRGLDNVLGVRGTRLDLGLELLCALLDLRLDLLGLRVEARLLGRGASAQGGLVVCAWDPASHACGWPTGGGANARGSS